jgi:hypothetical protein
MKMTIPAPIMDKQQEKHRFVVKVLNKHSSFLPNWVTTTSVVVIAIIIICSLSNQGMVVCERFSLYTRSV